VPTVVTCRQCSPRPRERLRKRAARDGGLDFRRDLWPLVATEVETVYYDALLKAVASTARRAAARPLPRRAP